jgi:uncharacterized membrane protein YeiH
VHFDAVFAPAPSAAFDVLSLLGTIAFAVSGAVAALRAGMDWTGVSVLAILTAVGGGSLRDVALGNLPMWWIADSWAFFVALFVGLALVPLRSRFSIAKAPDSWRIVTIFDALGLGAFTVIGASLSLSLGFAPWVAIAMGVLTGVGGGVLRDVLANTTPLVFTGQVYATASLAGALLFVVLTELDVTKSLIYWAPALLVLTIRLIAIRRKWEFPVLQMGSR